MKFKSNHIFSNSFIINFLSATQRFFSQYVTYNWFDGVLAGVIGAAFSVVFGVLSPLVNLTLDSILGMTTCGSN